MKKTFLIAAIFTAATVVGCKEEQTNSGSPAQPGGGAAATRQGTKHEEDHALGRDHTHDDGKDAHAGEKHLLGTQQIGGFSVTVTQVGDVKAGEGATFEIVPAGATGKPTAVRAWVGTEAADGSVKVKAVDRAKFFDADLEVPATLPPQSKLWVELESTAGKKIGSFDFRR